MHFHHRTHPVQPETKIMSPSTTAREYPIWASKGEPELISLRAGDAMVFRQAGFFGPELGQPWMG